LTTVDHLLVLQHLLRHPEIDTTTASRVCQQSQDEAREILSRMERSLGYLDRGGGGRGTYWTLRAAQHRRIAAPVDPERDRRLDWEAAKTRVLSILKQSAERGGPGLSNADIRQVTYLDRGQVKRLMDELRTEGGVRLSGSGRGARWCYGQETAE
jgi:ATP-dependent DNA helicase RecG